MPRKKTPSAALQVSIPVEQVERKIHLIRDQKVMLDSDLAELYEVETRVLNQAVKRNLSRFPEDFMFQLSKEEAEQLSRSQFVTLKRGQNIKYLPYVFTEQGVAMLSSVLRSERAVQVNIAIMRAFVKLRELMTTHRELSDKITALERKYDAHDEQIRKIFEAIRLLLTPPIKAKRPVGFRPPGRP